jgi:hypothetical protein
MGKILDPLPLRICQSFCAAAAASSACLARTDKLASCSESGCIAATISSSVRSGCRAISVNKNAACVSSGEMLPPFGLGAMLPVACRRCIHLIAELGLTSNQSAGSRRDAPDSTASTTLLPKKICRRCGPKQYILAVRHWPPVFDAYNSAFVLNRRINAESVMFRFLFLIESLRFFSGLFV